MGDVWAMSRRILCVGVAALSASCAAGGDGRKALVQAPEFKYCDVGGCGNLVVYATSSNRKEYLVVHASRKRLNLSEAQMWFDLAAPPDGLTVQVDLYRQPPEAEEPYCSDVADEGEGPIGTWKAVSGKLRVSLTGFVEARDGERQEDYWAHIRLEFAAFKNQAGDVIWQGAPIDMDAEVGWMNG